MLDTERILRTFGLFADLPDEELERWRGLCTGAEGRLYKRLRAECKVPGSVDMERLCTAAAAMAYDDYLVTGAAGGEVRVGDISLKGTAGQQSGDISEHFLARVADLLEPSQVLWQVES